MERSNTNERRCHVLRRIKILTAYYELYHSREYYKCTIRRWVPLSLSTSLNPHETSLMNVPYSEAAPTNPPVRYIWCENFFRARVSGRNGAKEREGKKGQTAGCNFTIDRTSAPLADYSGAREFSRVARNPENWPCKISRKYHPAEKKADE